MVIAYIPLSSQSKSNISFAPSIDTMEKMKSNILTPTPTPQKM